MSVVVPDKTGLKLDFCSYIYKSIIGVENTGAEIVKLRVREYLLHRGGVFFDIFAMTISSNTSLSSLDGEER